MFLLLSALPTLVFFAAQLAGAPQAALSLAVAVLAGGIIWLQQRRGWPQDAVFLGCNLHFLIAGPLLWVLFLSGLSNVAQPILDNVLLGVPLAVLCVLAWRAARSGGSWALVGVAAVALAVAATDAQNHIRAISIPLGLIMTARIMLARIDQRRSTAG